MPAHLMWAVRGQRQGCAMRALCRRLGRSMATAISTPGRPRNEVSEAMISADLMRQPISLKHVRELVSTERTTTLKWGQGKVLVCCGLEAVPGGTAEPEATAVFLAEGCVVCWQSSDAQRKRMLEIADRCLESPRARGFRHSRTSSLELWIVQGDQPRKVISSETLDMAEAAPGQKTHLNSNGQLMLTVDPEERDGSCRVVMPPPMQTAIETPIPDEPSQNVTPQLPWSSIPKFVPGTTNVQEYTQKLKFLAAMWPTEYLSQLAPRAALLVEGTAFRKVARLDPAKLRVNDQSGIRNEHSR
eukprot:s2655_g5.t1